MRRGGLHCFGRFEWGIWAFFFYLFQRFMHLRVCKKMYFAQWFSDFQTVEYPRYRDQRWQWRNKCSWMAIYFIIYTISFEGVIYCVWRHSYTPPWCVLVPPHEVLYFQQIGSRLRTAIETQCGDERTWTIEHAFSRHLSSSQMSHLNDSSRFLTEFYPVRLKLPPNCTGQRGANKNVVAAGAGHFIEYFEGVT